MRIALHIPTRVCILVIGLQMLPHAADATPKGRAKPAPATTSSPDEDFPSAQNPWKGEQLASKREQYKKSIETLMALPAEQVQAHPAAADFPGLPSATSAASAKPSARHKPTKSAASAAYKTTINTAVRRWHSTGLYAAPGQLITVTVPPQAVNAKLEIRIGCHTDKLWADKIDTWKRVPEISRSFKITSPVTQAANAFGGLVYIAVAWNAPAAEVPVSIEGGIAAPWYVAGKTTREQWRSVRNAPAPWAELECKGLIFSLPSEAVRQLDDPESIMQFWQKIIDAEDELAAKTERTDPERMVFDRQISLGYMHSGYPAMGPLSAAADAINPAKFKKGNWGVFHELGHNHQNGAWTFDGTTEVTVNLFSMYCFEKICGLPRSGEHNIQSPKHLAKVQQYLASGSFERDWKSDPFLALSMYDQLVEGFGWEPFKKVFAEYRDAPKSQLPKSDDDKRDQWLVRFSRTVGYNLGPFFTAWKVPTSEAARQSIQDLPKWMPGQQTSAPTGKKIKPNKYQRRN